MRNMHFFIFLLSLTNVVFSCAVCYGDPTHPVTIGMTKAIWFLLGVIGFILSCIAYGMINLIRKNKEINI